MDLSTKKENSGAPSRRTSPERQVKEVKILTSLHIWHQEKLNKRMTLISLSPVTLVHVLTNLMLFLSNLELIIEFKPKLDLHRNI